ncbi:SDR family NAD(P)-dependent oxidoreductase [Hoyosella altamirensis]|uniref:NAD(P)-dependent dehydrogenase (Short-subunit alcohol dehydrogenase family) n=1 Tax=Hoyosella altamirensis TaxID=616997 RepID=A0A839RGZ8_9ACTN|nr:SDR family oxidoreductase [Hoyosella altamirensis]MBB3035885.1 NAD(P)-dependent dehydrogenase (short-subunit alcohol dehydrogenase family) [Hoyosella altamirensis]
MALTTNEGQRDTGEPEAASIRAFANFDGRLAVVTGAASGIGRDLVFELVRKGTHVAACDLNDVKLRAVVRKAKDVNPEVRVTPHVCDVVDRAAVRRLMREVSDAHQSGVIHLLFNNAGTIGGMSFVKSPPDEWERTFAVSWNGTYNCAREFLPMLLASDQGAIVNTASVNALWASLGSRTPHSAYSSAKFAVRGFTESLLVDFQRNAPHLSAVLVLAGHVRTGMPAPPSSWKRALDSLFAGYEPVSSKSAAEQILNAVARGD